MKITKNIILLFLLILSTYNYSQETITADKAKDFLDKIISVEGKVVSYKLAPEGKKINYINIDKKFPEKIFTVIITNDWLPKFNLNFEDLVNKIIIVKGKISVYKNDSKQIPQIFNPISIEVKK